MASTFLSRPEPGRAQRHMQGIAARGAGEAVAAPLKGRKVLLQKRRLGQLALGDIVTVQASRAHDLDRTRNRRLGNRLLLGEGFFELAGLGVRAGRCGGARRRVRNHCAISLILRRLFRTMLIAIS